MKKVTIDGNEACANSAYLFTEVAGIYPITPSSPMAEHVDVWSNQGKLNLFNDTVKIIEMQSEAGAIGLVHGSLQAGCLTTTFTASQGLLLMIPNMYKIAGEMLPCVIHVAARSLSTHALSIFGDHQDIYATRSTGFALLASSSVQDAAYLSAVAHLAAIDSSLPFIHFFDGFRTSHEYQKVNILENKDIEKLINKEALDKFRNKALNPNHPITRGTAQNDDIYFQATEVRNKYYDALPNKVVKYMNEINEITGSNYKPFNYYGSKKATKIIVAMGSVCETIKETIDDLKDPTIGLIEVHLYRPFSKEYFLKVLPKTVRKIAVLDRTKECGSIGEPLYLDVKSVVDGIKVFGGRYGLSSKNTTPSQIKAVYDFLSKKPHHNFTIGINDDVTKLSLEVEDYKINHDDEMLIYGYGSDGMVSAAKSIVQMVGDNTEKYVQGYYQYDSKKSGGVTIGHLRFSKKPIKSTYYVETPELIVLTKDSYLEQFDVINNIKEEGTFLINTTKTDQELIDYLKDDVKKIIIERKVKVYTINAYKIAEYVGLNNKISMIMESAILRLSNVIDYKKAVFKLKEYVKLKFALKGNDIVEANNKAIDNAVSSLRKLSIVGEFKEEIKPSRLKVIKAINERKGNLLPVSSFEKYPDGTFPAGTSVLDKRYISEKVPCWIKQNCIQCNNCSLVCPHGVIRPFLLNQEEYDNAPEYIKERCIKPFEKNLQDYYYTIGISIADCTGCGLCIKHCLAKNKALTPIDMIKAKGNKEDKIFDYLVKNVQNKNLLPNTIKGTQFKEPLFCFSGACAGCGETPYIKLLTQIIGNKLMIANATGCSSIYGGSAPSMPYTIPWSSSLFEDNAEYGFGMLIASQTLRKRLTNIIKKDYSKQFSKWLENKDDYKVTKEVYDNLDPSKIGKEIESLKEYLIARSIWCIGGDGWAYDIGYGGIDHVLHSGEDINILVLDTQVYSNTGGQASKASPKGAIAEFASFGKKQSKKDLARHALAIKGVYVAQVSMGHNPNQVIKAIEEAENHKGPSIIIAYAPCISHGITGGMINSIESSNMATNCGYFPTFRFNPETNKFNLDSKIVDFEQYETYLNTQNRYRMLKKVNEKEAKYLLEENKKEAIATYEYYKNLEN